MEFEKAYYLLLHAKKIISDIEVEYAKHGVEWCEPNSVIINHMIDAENAIAKTISGMNDQLHDSVYLVGEAWQQYQKGGRNMTWIKTTDQLPPVGCYVLGYLGNRKEPKMLICKLDDGLFLGIDHREEEFFPAYDEDEVTHWTHLPNAPEVEG